MRAGGEVVRSVTEAGLAVAASHPNPSEDQWVGQLLPFSGRRDRLLDAVRELTLRDDGQEVHLGALDQSIAAALFWALRRPAPPGRVVTLNIELPRGSHDVAIMLGILAQLARHAADVAPVKPVSFTGSVVVIGMDTAMQRRLAGVTIRRIALSEGLEVHRVPERWSAGFPGRRSRPLRPSRETPALPKYSCRVAWTPR